MALTYAVRWQNAIRATARFVERQHELHPTYNSLNQARKHIYLVLQAAQNRWPDDQNVPKVNNKISKSVAKQLWRDKQFKLLSEPDSHLNVSRAPQLRPDHRDDRWDGRHRSPDRGYGYYRPHTRDRHRSRSPSPRRDNYYRSHTEEPRYRYHTRSPLPSPRQHPGSLTNTQ